MPSFSKRSLDNLAEVHPKLKAIVTIAIKTVDFVVIEGQRGKAEQEAAFKAGNTKVHFPNSAHNQSPSCAVDLVPYPVDWNDAKKFKAIADAMLAAAETLGVKLRWGGDFNRDGTKTTSDAWDKPHFELHPWRDWASGKIK